MTRPRDLPPWEDHVLLEHVLAEHGELHGLLEHLREMLEAPGRMAACLGALMLELERRLASHFEHEECGGYFDEVVQAQPNLQRRVDRLSEQHPQMLQMVRELQGSVDRGAAEESRVQWREFLRLFEAHEAEENRLLHDAFLRDTAAED